MPERTSIFSISLELTSLKTCKVKLEFSCKLDRCPHQRLGSGNASVFMQKFTDVLAKCVLLCFAKSFIEREMKVCSQKAFLGKNSLNVSEIFRPANAPHAKVVLPCSGI